MENSKKIVFVYNANSNPFKQAFDFFKRTAYPQTYQCNLTKLTHDGLNMKQQFQSFLQNSPFKAQFYHRDMFNKKYPDYKTELPVVLLQKEDISEAIKLMLRSGRYKTKEGVLNRLLKFKEPLIRRYNAMSKDDKINFLMQLSTKQKREFLKALIQEKL